MSRKSPSTRLTAPDPRPLFAGLGLFVLGGAMVATQLAQSRDLGWALVVVGGLTSLWWMSEMWRTLQLRRQLEQEAERKAAVRATRRQKDDEERTRRDAEKRAHDEQAAVLREQRAEEGRRRKEADDAAARERQEREAQSTAEIARLKSLPLSALRKEVLTRLESRGYGSVPTEGAEDRLERTSDGAQVLLRIIQLHSGRAADVRDLEAHRRDTGAAEAFLVSLVGFAPDALKAAQGKPITLVEAHLLAAWGAAIAETSPSP